MGTKLTNEENPKLQHNTIWMVWEKQTRHEKLEKREREREKGRGKDGKRKMEEGPTWTFYLDLVAGEKSLSFRTISMTNMEAKKNCFNPKHF